MRPGRFLSLLLTHASVASAHPNGDPPPIEVEVKGQAQQPVDGAGHLELSRRELLLRPSRAPGDLLEAVPGLVVVQHAGGGKANQYSCAVSTPTTAPTWRCSSMACRSMSEVTVTAKVTLTSTS